MKLLFDQNLSWRLVGKLSVDFPESQHVRDLNMAESQDVDIWDYAAENDFVIVSKDSDFQQRSLLFGHPPKVVRLRVGNCTIEMIEEILQTHMEIIRTFGLDDTKSYLVLP